jgi:ATP-dependent DNA helicase RecQ
LFKEHGIKNDVKTKSFGGMLSMKPIVFFDLEISQKEEIQDIGGITHHDLPFHDVSVNQFMKFIQGYEFLCGHNILKHDLKYLPQLNHSIMIPIDTLFLSPLLFPKKPYHNLLKDDKFNIDELNNPFNDSKKARNLFYDEIQNFQKLNDELKEIYYQLLHDKEEFSGFFQYIEYQPYTDRDLKHLIQEYFKDSICHNADIEEFIQHNPIELAYALAVISHLGDSITPRWVLMSYPDVENILHALKNNPCYPVCPYCAKKIDEMSALKEFFGYDQYREFNGVPLQQNAVKAAIENKSLLAIFPTGGGKSLTFQIPALIAGRNESGLTVVISPLQSLMKDQVDSLENKGIVQAVTINGSLDPVERSKAIERIDDGSAWILYISPESLRSKTIESLTRRGASRFTYAGTDVHIRQRTEWRHSRRYGSRDASRRR